MQGIIRWIWRALILLFQSAIGFFGTDGTGLP